MIDLDKFRMGYFLLWEGGDDFFGRRIRAFQKDLGLSKKAQKYVHIDVCGGGQWAVRAMPPKIVTCDIREQYKGRRYLLMKHNHVEYDRLRYKVAFWAATNVNVRYDLLGIMKFKIPFMFHSKKAFFCSENALWSLQKEVRNAFDMEPHKCVPGHFYDSKEIEILEEGLME